MEEWENQIVQDRKRVIFSEQKPKHLQSHPWRSALPFYDLALARFLDGSLKNSLETQNLFLHGNYLGSIGLSGLLEQSFALSLKLRKK